MEAVKTDLKESRSEFRIKAGTRLEVEKLRKAVIDAGFTPTWIRFEAVGKLVKQGGTFGLQVTGTGQVISLAADQQLERMLKEPGIEQPVAIVGVIPEGKREAQIEKFTIR